MPRVIGVDVESFGITGPVYAVGACDEMFKTKVWFGEIDARSRRVIWSPKQLEEMREVFNGAVWVGHNLGLFDKPRLEAKPFELRCADYEDTLPASHVYNSLESHDLKTLSTTKLHILRDDESELKELTQAAMSVVKACRKFVVPPHRRSKYMNLIPGSKIVELSFVEVDDSAWQSQMWLTRVVFPQEKVTERYLRLDCEGPLLLWKGKSRWPGYARCLKSHDLYEFYGVQKKYHPVVLSMQKGGIRLFVDKARKRFKEYSERIAGIETRFKMKFDVEPGSSKQMSELLFKRLGFPVIKEPEEGNLWPSVDRDVLNSLLERFPEHKEIKWIDMLTEYRELGTDVADIEGYIKSARGEHSVIAVNINPTRTKTTRGGCSEPNLQNVNKREGRTLRDLFGPMPGTWWYSYDMKRLELEIIAYLSQDETLNKWMREGKNVFLLLGDMVCKRCYGLQKFIGTDKSRSIGKTLTYGISYGAGPLKVAATIRQRLKVTIPESGVLHETFFGLFPGVRRLMSRLQSEVEDKGFIYTAQGYRLYVPENEPHAALDYAAQGTAGWRIKEAAVNIWEKIVSKRSDIRFALDVHDQLIFEGRPNISGKVLESIKFEMENNGIDGLHTPVALSIIKTNWAEERPANLKNGRIVYERKTAA